MIQLLAIFSIFTLASATNVPIIGVLAQETSSDKNESYIAASYVKFVESAGGRVVPVWIGQNQSYYEKIVNYTNGLLFPGGGANFDEAGGYAEAAGILYDLAIEANEQGVYYPVWGTCLGLEVISYIIAKKSILTSCSMENIAIPLVFAPAVSYSKLFPKSDEITYTLYTDNVTFNNHVHCLPVEALQDNSIKDWNIISTNDDLNSNVTFISTMENTKYPFYAVQFHPEKPIFEFKVKQIPHTENALKVSQYFSNFFVGESRKNDNSFPSEDVEAGSLIYNYLPTYTGIESSAFFEQEYIFSKSDADNSPLVQA